MGQYQPLVNGVAYDHANITVEISGVQVASITNIEYNTDRPAVNNKGMSPDPVSRGRGSRENTGSVEMSITDMQKLRGFSLDPRGSLVDLPLFAIVITYENGSVPIRHRMTGCNFTNDGSSSSVDGTDITYTLNIVFGAINLNA